jgi:type 1 glutamine amidotransferase
MSNGFRLHRLLCALAILLTANCLIAADAAIKPLRVAFMVGEDEYNAKETLPAFAEKYLKPLGVESVMIQSDPQKPNSFPELAKIDDADVLVAFVRRRPLPKDDLARIHKFLDAGKPLVGIRTACHAFAGRGGATKQNASAKKNGDTKKTGDAVELAEWPNFDVEVLGGHYTGHFANREGTDVTVLPDARSHPILSGIDETSFHSSGTLYKCGDLDDKTVTLMNGTTSDQGKPITEPVAWAHLYGKSRVFFTSLGHADDFKLPAFNHLLVNAIFWSANQRPPKFEAR